MLRPLGVEVGSRVRGGAFGGLRRWIERHRRPPPSQPSPNEVEGRYRDGGYALNANRPITSYLDPAESGVDRTRTYSSIGHRIGSIDAVATFPVHLRRMVTWGANARFSNARPIDSSQSDNPDCRSANADGVSEGATQDSGDPPCPGGAQAHHLIGCVVHMVRQYV